MNRQTLLEVSHGLADSLVEGLGVIGPLKGESEPLLVRLPVVELGVGLRVFYILLQRAVENNLEVQVVNESMNE